MRGTQYFDVLSESDTSPVSCSLATEAPHKLADFSRQDIQRRMEEDRERVSRDGIHGRLARD